MLRIFIFACIFFLAACTASEISKTETSQYRFSKIVNTEQDSLANQTILPYKTKLDESMNSVLGKTDRAMVKDMPEGLLGNLVADIIL
ncbi:MAG: hypothetical protein KJO64_08630 [Bacteroidia bacterium]|nr:hypothetical protein [Bacteroidia bacterium]